MRFVVVASLLAACAGDARAPAEPQLTLAFEARVGDAPFSCSSLATGMGTTSATVEPLDFRIYVHDVRLLRADGSEVPLLLVDDGKWQSSGVALLDFEDKTGSCRNGTPDLNTALRGTAPAGEYVGLKLKIGVPFALNHADSTTLASPLNLSSLYWDWNAGHKFARIDGRLAGSTAAPTEATAFNIHLGSLQCRGAANAITDCSRPNIGEVELRGFDPTAKTILVDYKALVAKSDLTRDLGGASGCMAEADDPECPPILAHLGVRPTSGQPDATQQALFRVE